MSHHPREWHRERRAMLNHETRKRARDERRAAKKQAELDSGLQRFTRKHRTSEVSKFISLV